MVESISQRKQKRDYGIKKLSQEQILQISDQKTLQLWRHLPLWKRVKSIEQQFDVKLSISTLRNIYKANAISFYRIGLKYYRKSSELEFRGETHRFVR